jgi:WD40 repeat protein
MRAIILSINIILSTFAAASANPYRDCDDGSLAACTAIIESSAEPRYRAVAYYNRALRYHYAGDFDRAIDDYTHAIQMKPDDADAYDNRGVCYNVKKQYDQAIADFNQAIRIKPRTASTFYNRGLSYQAKGAYSRAIADYSRALAIDPRLENAASQRREAQAALDKQSSQNGERKSATAPTFTTKIEPSSKEPKKPDQAVSQNSSAARADPLKAASASHRNLAAEIVPNSRNTGSSIRGVAAAMSVDGRLLVTASGSEIALWDVASGHALRRLIGHAMNITAVAFAPTGQFVISASEDETIKVWDVTTGAVVRTLEGKAERVTGLALSPDGGAVAASSEHGPVQLWSLATGRKSKTLHGAAQSQNPFGGWFRGPAGSRTVEFDVGERSYSVAFSPDGKYLATGSPAEEDFGTGFPKYMVILWDAATGKIVRKFPNQEGLITALAFSPDGKRILSGGGGNKRHIGIAQADNAVRLWDIQTGALLKTFEGAGGDIQSFALSPDGKRFAAGIGRMPQRGSVKVWDLASGAIVQSFDSYVAAGPSSIGYSPNGKAIFIAGLEIVLLDARDGKLIRTFGSSSEYINSAVFRPGTRELVSAGPLQKGARLWDMKRGVVVRSFEALGNGGVETVALSRDGARLAISSRDKTLGVWEVQTGRLLSQIKGNGEPKWGDDVYFLPNGSRLMTCTPAESLRLWDIASGALIRTLDDSSSCRGHQSLVFTPDGKRAIGGQRGDIWDIETGKKLGELEHQQYNVDSPRLAIALSPDGKTLVAGSGYTGAILTLFDAQSGKAIHTFSDHAEEKSVSVEANRSGWVKVNIAHDAFIHTLAFSPDGTRVYSCGADYFIKVWDTKTGQPLRTFKSDQGTINSLSFTGDGKIAASAGEDGTIKLWRADDGQRIGSSLLGSDAASLTITPQGFFGAAGNANDLLSVVRGLDLTMIDQVHQSLYNPDLVEEALAGDPEEEVKRAATVINLEKVLDSGPAPLVEIASQPSGFTSHKDLVAISARIKDRGKGVGRIEWRVNGVTVGVMKAPAGPGPDYTVSRELALDPGENRIEVVAYEGRNILASLPAQFAIAYDSPADAAKPKLHILAIGIDAYPGDLKLNQAVEDAKALADEMRKAVGGVYSEVRVRTVLDAEATAEGLDKAINEFAAGVHPRDTFIFFAAAHGYSQGGRFYLIPQDYPYPVRLDAQALASHAIGQEKLQDWIANRIKAKKAIILLDTCESGALTSGYTRSRVDSPASEAAIGRLHEATGRPVLTAAAEGQEANETAKLGHGVFTYALLQALHHGDANGDGLIEVSELAAYVEDLVPKLVRGGEGRSAIPRGAGSGGQSARFGTTGSDFALVARLP